MQLSKFNKLFKLFSTQKAPDGYGGFDSELKELYQLFGSISNISGKGQYKISIAFKEPFLIDDLSLIEYNSKRLIIDKISFDKNIMKIYCHDQRNPENPV